MDKSSDSSTSTNSESSTTTVGCSGRGCNKASATSGEANQNEILQKHHHIHTDQKNLTPTSTTKPTKNQPNNSLGCGSSSTTTTAPTTSSGVKGNGSNDVYVGGNSNLRSNKIITSLKNTTLGHQYSNNTDSSTIVANAAAAVLSSLSVTALNPTTPQSTSLSTQIAPINLNISTTTGRNFSVSVDLQITVENLKKLIAKKLKVSKDRICLLHREKELQDGSLKDNNLMNGSKIILIPNVETGLLAQRPESTVMQALEALNDSQVNDFLSGKTPLNLSMRLGDHMMLIQLQLSTVNPNNNVAHSGGNCSSSSSRQRSSHHHHHHHRSSRISGIATTATQTTGTVTPTNHSHHHHHHHHHHHNSNTTAVAGTASNNSTTTPAAVSDLTTAQNLTPVRKLELDTTCQTPRINSSNTSSLIVPYASRAATNVNSSNSSTSFLRKNYCEVAKNNNETYAAAQSITTSNATNSAVQTTSIVLPNTSATSAPVVAATSFHASSEAVLLEQSPIKSLSNLVSSPIKTTAIKNIPKMSNNTNSSSNSNNVALGPHTALISAVTTTSSNISIAAANSAMCQDPIAAKLTSCLCTRLNSSALEPVNNTPHNSAKQCIETTCVSQQQQQLQTVPHHHHHHNQQTPATRSTTGTIMASTPNYKTPSCIITALNGSINSSSSSSSSKTSTCLHKTAHNPISRKHRHHHHHHHHHHHYHLKTGTQQQQLIATNNHKVIPNTSTPNKDLGNESYLNFSDDSLLNGSLTKSTASPSASSSSSSPSSSPPTSNSINQTPVIYFNTTPVVAATAAPLTTSNTTLTTTTSSVNSTTSPANVATPVELDDSGIVSDSRTLAEASRNLTQTLRKLSKEVFTNKIDFSASEENSRKSGSGAVIESMKNHGKGIYSGTFSGTLNPALQDRYGRPKRDISTVIHILNDLLSATPQYHRGARISFEAPSTSAAAAASVAAASGSTGTIHHSSRSKHHVSSKHHQSSHPCIKCIKTHNSSTSAVNLQSVPTSNTSGATNSHSSSSSITLGYSCGECSHYAVSKSHSTKTYACCQQDSAGNSSSSAAVATAAVSAIPQQNQNGHNSNASNTTSNRNANGHHHHHHGSSHHHHHHHHQTSDECKVCQCRYRVHSENADREIDHTCLKCAAELDNIKTKSKLDQLRLVMQQRKQKREARKLKGAPYGARVLGTTTTATASDITASSTSSTITASNSTITTPISEVAPNLLVEEVDTAA